MIYFAGIILGILVTLVYVGGQRGWGEFFGFLLPLIGIAFIIYCLVKHLKEEDL